MSGNISVISEVGGFKLQKIYNSSSDIIQDMFQGFLAAHSRDYTCLNGKPSTVIYRNRRRGKVSVVIGGGSGHDPLFYGFAGKGMADAAVSGNIFTSPNPQAIYEAAEAVNEGKGILFLYGCYAGDNMNFDIAEELCQCRGIQTAHVRITDDCASAPRSEIHRRRGIAGDIYVFKIAGAAADAGLSLEEVTAITERARDHVVSIGLATAPGSIPGLGRPTFELPDGQIEFGMGIHGEPGIECTEMKDAGQLVTRMYELLKNDIMLCFGDEVAVLVNGLGSTTLLELNIVYGELHRLLSSDGVTVHDVDIGSFCTCQEMGGFSLTLFKLDEELKRFYDAPCYTPYYAKEDLRT